MRAALLVVSLCGLLRPALCPALEVSTGFLIGPRYDPHAFYVRVDEKGLWQKTYSGREYKRQAQGKLLGALVRDIAPASLDELKQHGFLLAGVELQSASVNAFEPTGAMKPEWRDRLEGLIRAANDRGMVVELTCFNQNQDENFDSPDAILTASRNVADWLIEKNLRNVILSVAAAWSQPGWDFDNFVALHLEQIVDSIRGRFQERGVDYLTPIAISTSARVNTSSNLVRAGDLLMLNGEAVQAATLKLAERPQIVTAQAPGDCATGIERGSGCLLVGNTATAGQIAPLVYNKPPHPEH